MFEGSPEAGKFAIVHFEDLERWCCWNQFPDFKRTIDVDLGNMVSSLKALWALIDPSSRNLDLYVPADDRVATRLAQRKRMDEEWAEKLNPEFVLALARLPDGERWKIAERWAAVAMPASSRPKSERMKQTVKQLCAIAERAVTESAMILCVQNLEAYEY